ncbi:D-glycero-alpha-D-manno-heptose-1,7-bisphosphate 7-phosphatase [Pacificibacter marinus]|uniref:D-glycero-alpha-D-manno-heptose-1,7-bisphosphate 7-phosphatase n=1 Tax=Pacificibacter marinus TaxID=658057 RepID=UPI001C079935|nr:HAD family hydrolase [Pacificibacter marinus]MBU2867477.1 HAD family hydrolase [Pacificibacter marinus]
MTYEVVYLDRDGTINIDRHYLSTPDGFEFCDGALAGMKQLSAMGLDLVVITNQSGIARGYFGQKELDAIHDVMREKLKAEGVSLAGIYACPHGPDDTCACRKPLPGMIHQAEKDLGRRPGLMIGDAVRDVQAGQAAGLHTIGLFSPERATELDEPATYLATNLIDAAQWIATKNEG